MQTNLTIQPVTSTDQDTVVEFIHDRWGAETVVAHATVYRPAELPGFMARLDGALVGLITYHIIGDACEIVTLDSTREGIGVGAALIEDVRQTALQSNCKRLWLITTNDNLNALRFYQKRGFELVAIHRYAVDRARLLKPQIPLIGDHGIPLRDEIELGMLL